MSQPGKAPAFGGGPRVLYQDARWPWYGRLLYGWILYALWLAGAIGGALKGSGFGVELKWLGLFLLAIAVCEWRVSKMGLVITGEGVEAVRAVNRTRISWEHIDGFVLKGMGGRVDYGDRKVWIKRSRGAMIPVPTLVITPQKSWWRWYFSPARLKWAGGEVADVMTFLNGQLAEHRPPPISI